MPVDLSHMMDMIVVDEITFIHILGPRSVAAKQDASSSHVFNVVAGDLIVYPVQVHPDGTASAVKEMALFNGTIPGTTQPDKSIGLVVHIPVVLQPGIIRVKRIALNMFEGKATEAKVADRYIHRAFLIDIAFDSNKLQ